MARQIVLTVVVDLAKGTKEAHERTISRLATGAAEEFVQSLSRNGYTVRSSGFNLLMHYVRHDNFTWITKPAKAVRRLKRVVA